MTITPPNQATDTALLDEAARGDERAVGTLYDRYGRVLYAVAYRIVRNATDAEDVVLDTFGRAWSDAARFDARRGSVAAWLTVMARSRALDVVRSRARRERLTADAGRSEPGVAPGMGTSETRPDDETAARERERQVAAALATLSPPQRTAIELAFFEGLSHSEIAERLHEPLGTVKTRVRLGMQKLRETLRPYFYERMA
jgi:RNA polymerase sigma-70 factor (ECF subfamily)